MATTGQFYCPSLGRSHWPLTDHHGALEALGRFCDLYETGELPEYHDTVDTFIASWTQETRYRGGAISSAAEE